MTGVFIKMEIFTQRQTRTQESHVTMKAEIGMMNLQAKGHQKLPANQQKLQEKHGSDTS